MSISLGVDIFPGGLVTTAKPITNGTSKVAANKSLESTSPGTSGTATTTQSTQQKQKIAQRQATTVVKTTTPSIATQTAQSLIPSSQTAQQSASQSLPTQPLNHHQSLLSNLKISSLIQIKLIDI